METTASITSELKIEIYFNHMCIVSIIFRIKFHCSYICHFSYSENLFQEGRGETVALHISFLCYNSFSSLVSRSSSISLDTLKILVKFHINLLTTFISFLIPKLKICRTETGPRYTRVKFVNHEYAGSRFDFGRKFIFSTQLLDEPLQMTFDTHHLRLTYSLNSNLEIPSLPYKRYSYISFKSHKASFN